MATNNSFNRIAVSDGLYSPASTVGTGNPNGAVAGTKGDFFFDTSGAIGYTCTTTGNTTGAVWTADASATSSFTWQNTTTTTQAMAVQNGYISNNAALTTFTLPTTGAIGQRVAVEGAGAGGWTIVYGTGQLIHFGTITTTTTTGSLSSTNQYDGCELICIVANTTWKVKAAPNGNLTYV